MLPSVFLSSYVHITVLITSRVQTEFAANHFPVVLRLIVCLESCLTSNFYQFCFVTVQAAKQRKISFSLQILEYFLMIQQENGS